MDPKVLIAAIPSNPKLDAFFGPKGWQGMVVSLSTALSGKLNLLIEKNDRDVMLQTDIDYRLPACQARATDRAARKVYLRNILLGEAIDMHWQS